MKKTLAIVLAVLMAVAALSSFAFIVGNGEKKADFELTRIFAADIDVTQAGVRSYENVQPSENYWTPGKSLCIAVEFRVWNRTLDGHDGAKIGDEYTVAVTTPTADVTFAEYAVTKVASYVVINGVKQLSHVSAMPLYTVNYSRALNAAVFGVKILPQITPAQGNATNGTKTNAKAYSASGATVINVYNDSILGIATVKGYVATPAWIYDADPVTNASDLPAAASLDYLKYTGGTIGVPTLVYGSGLLADPSHVDYIVFLSAKHTVPNAEGNGELSASFALTWGDEWKSLAVVKNVENLEKLLGMAAGDFDTAAADLEPTTLENFYGAAPTVTSLGYTKYLKLSELGFIIIRSDYEAEIAETLNGFTEGDVRSIIRYDVYRYDALSVAGVAMNLRYVASYVTEDLILTAGASAIQLEYDGAEVALNMWGNFIRSSGAAMGAISGDDTFSTYADVTKVIRIEDGDWADGAALNTAIEAQRQEIIDLNKMHAQFATGIGQAEGWPIYDDQFTANAALPKFSTPITNTYKAGETVPVEVAPVDEGTETPADEVDGEIVEGDEIDVPTAGDATIAFVCAAAAILACAALAFVMKKAR